MRAVILNEFGGIENFAIREVPIPDVKPDEVLIRIHAIGIDQIDIKTRKGSGMASKYPPESPIILGWDVSGVVVEKGTDVTDIETGDEVFGTINFPGAGGAYAEYIAAPANQLAKKPENISHPEAAAATQSPLTAWQALVKAGKLREGMKVLIHGAAGGVGNYAVQIAKSFGANVTATAAGKDFQFVKDLGADEIIDYQTQQFEELTDGFDLILDSIGGENFVRSLKVLGNDGRIILLPSDKKEDAEKAAREQQVNGYSHILMHSSGDDMKQIARMLEEGAMKVYISKIFAFEEIPQAQQQLEEGGNTGKIVIEV